MLPQKKKSVSYVVRVIPLAQFRSHAPLRNMAPFSSTLFLSSPLRQAWKSNSKLAEDESSEYGTEKTSEPAEIVVALRDLRLRRHEEDWLYGCAVEVSFGHFSLL